MSERWVVYQADQYEEEWVRYQGRPNEERGVSRKSLPDGAEESYDSYTHGSAAVEVFINAHAVEMPNPLGRIRALEARVADYETRLSAVMPPDYKDWHENARSEWPEVAALTISSLREREEFFQREFVLALDTAEAHAIRIAELESLLDTRSHEAGLYARRMEQAQEKRDTALARVAELEARLASLGFSE